MGRKTSRFKKPTSNCKKRRLFFKRSKVTDLKGQYRTRALQFVANVRCKGQVEVFKGEKHPLSCYFEGVNITPPTSNENTPPASPARTPSPEPEPEPLIEIPVEIAPAPRANQPEAVVLDIFPELPADFLFRDQADLMIAEFDRLGILEGNRWLPRGYLGVLLDRIKATQPDHAQIAAELQKLQNIGKELSEQCLLYKKKHYGHFLSELIIRNDSEQRASYTNCHIANKEVCFKQIFDRPACQMCLLPHLSGTPPDCQQYPYVHGTQEATDLARSKRWLDEAVCLVLGTDTLTYLPPALLHKFINIGLLPGIQSNYRIGYNPHVVEPMARHSKLRGMFKEKLNRVPHDCALPVLVEFKTSDHADAWVPLHEHLFGFFVVVSKLKHWFAHTKLEFCIVLGPVLYKPRGLGHYRTDKDEHKELSHLGIFFSALFGIPFFPIRIQELEGSFGTVRRAHWWIQEPLFNFQGGPTREFFRRLEVELRKVISIMHYSKQEANSYVSIQRRRF